MPADDQECIKLEHAAMATIPSCDPSTPRSRSPRGCTRHIATRASGMFTGFITIGISHALLGLTLLELQLQTSADLASLTLLVTWSFVGRLVSTAVAGSVSDRVHPELQLAVCLLASGAVSAGIPLCARYAAVSALVALQGVCIGYYLTVSNVRCFELWPLTAGPYLQALFSMFSVGGAIAPTIVKPFLTRAMQPGNVTLDDQSRSTNSTPMRYNEQLDSLAVMSHNVNNASSHLIINRGTFYPYLILAILQAIVGIYMCIFFCIDNCKFIRKPLKRMQQREMKTRTKNKQTDLSLLALFSMMIFCSNGIEATFSSLLYTYTVKFLSWGVDEANKLALAFWITFALSRALGMIHARFISPETALTCFLSIMLPSFSIMAAASYMNLYVMWVCVPAMGIALSTQIASIMLYAGKYFPISGRTSSIMMACNFLSGMGNPALTGYLFKNVGMQWFIYVQLVFSVIMAIVFVITRVLCEVYMAKSAVLEVDIEPAITKKPDKMEDAYDTISK